MLRNAKVLLTVMAIVVIAGGAYAFAAANTVADNSAGYVGTTVAGYDVTEIAYDLNVSDPTTVDKITFSISPDTGAAVAVTVIIQVDGNWKICTVAAATAPAVNATCDYTGDSLALADIVTFNVVASSSVDAAP